MKVCPGETFHECDQNGSSSICKELVIFPSDLLSISVKLLLKVRHVLTPSVSLLLSFVQEDVVFDTFHLRVCPRRFHERLCKLSLLFKS